MSLTDNGNVRKLAENAIIVLAARGMQVIGVPVACVLLTIYLQSASAQRKDINQTLGELNKSIAVLQTKTSDIYSRGEASRDFDTVNARIDGVNIRVTGVNEKVDGNTHRIEALETVRNRFRR